MALVRHWIPSTQFASRDVECSESVREFLGCRPLLGIQDEDLLKNNLYKCAFGGTQVWLPSINENILGLPCLCEVRPLQSGELVDDHTEGPDVGGRGGLPLE